VTVYRTAFAPVRHALSEHGVTTAMTLACLGEDQRDDDVARFHTSGGRGTGGSDPANPYASGEPLTIDLVKRERFGRDAEDRSLIRPSPCGTRHQ
jgi:hypothetical protein